MQHDNEGFRTGRITDIPVCGQHSGLFTQSKLLIWMIGILIVAILGSIPIIVNAFGDTNKRTTTSIDKVVEKMSSIDIRLAEMLTDKTSSEAVHTRLSERINDLEAHVRGDMAK